MGTMRAINVTKPEDDPAVTKRWFESDFFDLFVWSRDAAVFHIQLCYGKPVNEYAVSWRDGLGFFHDGVLLGPERGGVAWTALLEQGGRFDFTKVNARFLRESQGMDIALRKLVLAKLHHFALNGPTHPDKPPRIKVRRYGNDAADAPAADAPPADGAL